MARINNKVVFNVAWPTSICFDGNDKPATSIERLCKQERVFLAYAGSSDAGWAIYVVDAANRDRKQQISPLFCKDFGDTRRDIMQACARAYGVERTPVLNLGREHPEECFYWMTV